MLRGNQDVRFNKAPRRSEREIGAKLLDAMTKKTAIATLASLGAERNDGPRGCKWLLEE